MKVLLVTLDQKAEEVLCGLFGALSGNISVMVADTIPGACARLAQEEGVGIVISGALAEREMGGIDLWKHCRERHPKVSFLLLPASDEEEHLAKERWRRGEGPPFLARQFDLGDFRPWLGRVGMKERDKMVIDAAVIRELRLLQDEADPDLLLVLIGMYLDTTPRRLDRLAQAILARDSLKVANVAHDLKSSSANLGVVELRDLCFKVEASAKAGDWEALEEHREKLSAQYQAAKKELEKILAEG